jgi:centrosomal protein CEP104
VYRVLQQVVEIATYSDHLMTECAQKDLFQRCPRCSEAVLKTEYRSHNADKSGAHIG